MTAAEQTLIDRNRRAHSRVHRRYERRHGEIFNDLEQDRLRHSLGQALAELRTGCERPRALDFGCGTGNLSRHLLELGCEVVAADIAPAFLQALEQRHRDDDLRSFRLNGRDLTGLEDSTFDVVGSYSVLHHIPDYLGAVSELMRVLRPGGVLYIDHEADERFWAEDAAYEDFRREVDAAMQAQPKRLRRFLDRQHYRDIATYWHDAFRRLFNPRYMAEGDIHVWPDDHLEWAKIEAVVAEEGGETLWRHDYLLYRSWYPREVWQRYQERTTDTRTYVARKRAVAP
jgi:SAM-dependent methyltransferase